MAEILESSFREQLRALRQRADLTLEDLAQEIGVGGKTTVSGWETGRYLPQHRDLIAKIAQAVGASPQEEEHLRELAGWSGKNTAGPGDAPSAISPVTSTSLEKGYLKQVRERMGKVVLAWGGVGNIERANVHARLAPLVPRTWLSQDVPPTPETSPKFFEAESLLLGTEVRAAILAPLGAGKSTLWRRLAGRLASASMGHVIPVPIDWRWLFIDKPDSVQTLLASVVKHVWSEPANGRIDRVAAALKTELEAGTAVALIDNWSGFDGLPDSLAAQMRGIFANRRWKRFVLFGRYEPLESDVGQLDLYQLTPLNTQEVQRFVQVWPLMTGKSLDVQKTIDAISASKPISDLASSPLFLDLLCAKGAPTTFPQKRWTLLEWTVQHMLKAAMGGNVAGLRFRAMLTDLALSGYVNQNNNLPVQYQFDAAKIDQLWQTKLGDNGEKMFRIAYEQGLLRTLLNEQQIAFSHQVVQSFLAAEAWINQDHWLEQVTQVKSEPPWSEVIILAASALAHNGRLVELERLLQNLCDAAGSDVADLNWQLAGQCLVELNEADQAQIDRTDIGQALRQRLIEWLRHPGSFSIAMWLQEALPQMQGEVWAIDVAEVARDRAALLWPRYTAIGLLGELGGTRAIETLSQIALDDFEEEGVRLQAVTALGRTQAVEALAALEELLPQPAWAGWVVEALVVHNSPGAAQRLLRAWDGTQIIGEAIRRLSLPQVLPILRQKLEAHPDSTLTYFLLEAVANVGSAEASETLRPYLEHAEWAMFEHVTGLLSKMKSRAACQVLVEYAEDERHSWHRRGHAIRALPHEPGLWDVKRLVTWLLLSDQSADSAMDQNADVEEAQGSYLQIVSSAVAVLSQTSDAEIDLQLEKAIKTAKAPLVRACITNVLADKSARPRLVTLMTQLAHDHSYFVQHEAICALGRWQVPEIANLALHVLERDLSKGRDVSRLCQASGYFKDQRAVPLLANILQTEDQPAAYEALVALGMIGGAEATAALVIQGRRWNEDGKGEWLQQVLMRVLAENGEADAVRLLIELGTSQKRRLAQIDILRNLTRVRNAAAVEVLIAALSHPLDDIRGYAIEALGHIGDERAVPQLIALAFDPIEWVREAAIKAVQDGFKHIRWTESIQAAVRALRHAELNVRYLGLVVLSQASPELVSPEIIAQIRGRLVADKSLGVRQAAVKALGKLTGAESTFYLCELLQQSDRPDWALTLLETLHDIGDPRAVETMVEVLRLSGGTGMLDMFSSPWRYLLRIELLSELVRFLPVTQPLVARLSLAHDLRVLPDGSIYLSDGRRLSHEAAVHWLQIEQQD